MDSTEYDLIVIGSGPAGEKGALTAAFFGKRVALVEKKASLGGAVANTGTLPSKTLRETALALSGFRARELHGVDLSVRRAVTIADFMHHEKAVASQERGRIAHYLDHLRVTLVRGTGSFVDAHTLRVTGPEGEQLLRGKTFLIATGSSPLRPPEFAFEDERVCDSDEILRLSSLPGSLVVVGAGVIGSEYACTFAALGARVHVVDGRDRLLSFLDGEVSSALAAAMQRLGIVFQWQERVTRCDVPEGRGDVTVHLSNGSSLQAAAVLVASGRSSNTADLGLDKAGVTIGKRGLIPVDPTYRTNVPHIYAAGDVIGAPALAATGAEQARVAMSHAFDLDFKAEIAPILPYGIYTIPEASMAGETEESLREKGEDYVVGKAFYRDNGRGAIIGDRHGFLKLLFRRRDLKLLGVHVLGEQASELVHVGLVVLLADGGFDLFNRICFNYPTLGVLYQRAAYDAAIAARGTTWDPSPPA
jgi:NAD(P) transhydrogenase